VMLPGYRRGDRGTHRYDAEVDYAVALPPPFPPPHVGEGWEGEKCREQHDRRRYQRADIDPWIERGEPIGEELQVGVEPWLRDAHQAVEQSIDRLVRIVALPVLRHE